LNHFPFLKTYLAAPVVFLIALSLQTFLVSVVLLVVAMAAPHLMTLYKNAK